jgi:hypothetical protein
MLQCLDHDPAVGKPTRKAGLGSEPGLCDLEHLMPHAHRLGEATGHQERQRFPVIVLDACLQGLRPGDACLFAEMGEQPASDAASPRARRHNEVHPELAGPSTTRQIAPYATTRCGDPAAAT